ncbi:hypothetical protein EHI8A_029420 [Entamoeba histolytica HM-1:IMSS-B]|uniref:Uncharacterized protein n=5 Tax=Entamoeba histolytica TaxID=5759 RepID=C4M662_ENTH1|nr:hypothetical protein EHI_042940 [Entamoeba histolytica HM-1:IMSS]EMD47382.1 Hypothetical protein EHI5A_056540 [Entamoeba histolytica KU27]EMH72539.1 hypothetical protein EHI8A_029420 [Entamoeba histolytica HM-1:IMSS-B]EMS16753.1 hypothetical protein KM1_067650 [Entamoeba histolytica HM-3:IMSS]ENY61045.1 hypothetical protein EHI7A_032480 [Entamoeba histolytica HM-1:IMSS-A]EAL47253.1 hypothetical protein EHI_042940 [Entamoeba histolytica HM-1:IMSS]|eukprot:XP_652639.1 hypothetical protein EHI_042940 [Entamoeba histolytica HM-1:IMSS]
MERNTNFSRYFPIESRYNIIELCISILSMLTVFMGIVTSIGGIIHNENVFIIRFVTCCYGVLLCFICFSHSLCSVIIRRKDIPYPKFISYIALFIGLISFIFIIIIMSFTFQDTIDGVDHPTILYYERITHCCHKNESKEECGCLQKECNLCEDHLMKVLNGWYYSSIVLIILTSLVLIFSALIHHLIDIQLLYRNIYKNFLSNGRFSYTQIHFEEGSLITWVCVFAVFATIGVFLLTVECTYSFIKHRRHSNIQKQYESLQQVTN